MRRPRVQTLCLVHAGLLLSAAPGSSQIVPIRTVPVASGDQFLMLPSESLAMGGVRVALDDALADPWSNPAKGVLVPETAFMGSPTYYTISDRGGAGRTFPVAGMFTGSVWFGGAALALQQIENEPGNDFFIARPQIDIWGPPQRLSDASARNLYSTAFVGRRLGGEWSIGLGLAAATLDALDGVDLLYVDADRIEQSGGTQDVRLGLYRRGATDRLSLLLLHSRISMTHDVTYSGWIWDDLIVGPVPQSRVEVSQDQTRTWGAQIGWDRDLNAPGWRIGLSATANRKSHPKIPNYEIQNIPRDPGTTWAYEVAAGFAREAGPTTFGLDVALQPIWSETWQEASAQDVLDSGGVLEIGDRSIENDFFFTNVILRTGLAHDVGRATLQGGLEVRSYDYTLEQVNHVVTEYREQDESWMEWTPTFGVAFSFSELDVRYAGRLTSGTGQPGIDQGLRVFPLAEQAASADFILAPQGPLTLQDARVLTHQLSVRIPVR